VERTSPRGGRGGKERPNSAFGRWTSRPDRILGAGGAGGYAVTSGSVSADGKKPTTPNVGKKVPFSRLKKVAELKHRLEGSNLPPYKADVIDKVKYFGEHQSHEDPAF